MLALHLLQNAIVYINTLMIQRVLSEEAWMQRLTADDLRALTPLIDSHVSPYGTFVLDMHSRLDIEPPVTAFHPRNDQDMSKTTHKSVHVPQNADNGTRQLALFNSAP